MSKQKIIDLVYQGNVLDEHGVWVPISVQVKREREFLEHLENGEVLIGGTWKKLAYLSGSTTGLPGKSTPAAPLQHADPLETPEETIDMSYEQIAAAAKGASPPEGDFPPETAVLKVEQPAPRQKPKLSHLSTFDYEGNTQVDMVLPGVTHDTPQKEQIVTHETEFEETVLFNIKSIQAQIDAKNKKNRDSLT